MFAWNLWLRLSQKRFYAYLWHYDSDGCLWAWPLIGGQWRWRNSSLHSSLVHIGSLRDSRNERNYCPLHRRRPIITIIWLLHPINRQNKVFILPLRVDAVLMTPAIRWTYHMLHGQSHLCTVCLIPNCWLHDCSTPALCLRMAKWCDVSAAWRYLRQHSWLCGRGE